MFGHIRTAIRTAIRMAIRTVLETVSVPNRKLRSFKLLENEGAPGRAGETTAEEPIYKCCGKYPNRIPFQFRSSEGEERRCCEGTFFVKRDKVLHISRRYKIAKSAHMIKLDNLPIVSPLTIG